MCSLWLALRRNFMHVEYHMYVNSGSDGFLRVDTSDAPSPTYCADPFLFYYDNDEWLFCETIEDGKGVVGCFKHIGKEWRWMGVVLRDERHLSYPQIFKDGDGIYMLPESCDSRRGFARGRIVLYEAVDFPFVWKERKILIQGPYADATLLKESGHYYLSALRVNPDSDAMLWHADSLFGDWVIHPAWRNQHQTARLRRNGGAFLRTGGGIFRIVQDNDGDYGKAIYKIPVLRITPQNYQEGEAELMFGSYVHTYNQIMTPNGMLEVIDRRSFHMNSLGACVRVGIKLFIKKVMG